MTASGSTKPDPRGPQFSLRTLLLLFVVAAIILGFIRWRLDVAAYREEVLAKLGFPWLPEWEGKNLVGLSIWLTDAPAPEHLARLKHVPNLRRLTLWFSDVTDAHLEHLKVLPRLEVLDLINTDVTDAGLEHLEHLTTLRKLGLSGTDITDKGLARIEHLRNLEKLSIRGTDVSDAGLVHIRRLTKLHELWIDGTQISDRGVRQLKKELPRCRIYH